MPRILPGWNWPAVSEFQGYTGDCMQDALMACMAAERHIPPSPIWLNRIVQGMAARNLLAAPNGATNVAACGVFARECGYKVIDEQDYAFPTPSPFLPILQRYSGISPILFNVQNGQALRDDWKGTCDEKGLKCHGIAVLGLLDNGDMVCMDGDNPEAAIGRFCAYSPAVLTAAQPCGWLVFGSN